MATKPANAKQRKWMSDIADFIEINGLDVLYGPSYLGRTDFQLHHVLGRSAKHNKVAIGHWFVIPVPVELHDVNSDHALNVTHHKRAFTRHFGKQSSIFAHMFRCMRNLDIDTPPEDVFISITDTHV